MLNQHLGVIQHLGVALCPHFSPFLHPHVGHITFTNTIPHTGSTVPSQPPFSKPHGSHEAKTYKTSAKRGSTEKNTICQPANAAPSTHLLVEVYNKCISLKNLTFFILKFFFVAYVTLYRRNR